MYDMGSDASPWPHAAFLVQGRAVSILAGAGPTKNVSIWSVNGVLLVALLLLVTVLVSVFAVVVVVVDAVAVALATAMRLGVFWSPFLASVRATNGIYTYPP